MIRRNFLKTSGLFSLTPLVPGFVNRLAASTIAETDQPILVVIEMSGGNDGININQRVPDFIRKQLK